MMITAHGGSMGTGRNSYKYFTLMKDIKVDAVEVDVKCRGDLFYLTHSFSLKPENNIRLNYVFDYIKRYDFRVNLDLKKSGMTKTIVRLAKEAGVEDRVYFTGYLPRAEYAEIDGAECYMNYPLFPKIALKAKNVGLIVEYLRSLGNPRIKGINVNYRRVDEEFLCAAKEAGLKLSLFVVDDESALDFLINAHPELDNITTNIPIVALDILKRAASRK